MNDGDAEQAENSPSDEVLLADVDNAMSRARELAGSRWACGPGRTECCHGPFPINALDARRLRRGLAVLRATDSPRADALERRVEDAGRTLAVDFPGDPLTGVLGEDDAAEEGFCASHAGDACPVLDPATGLCDLYGWRPLSCRTFGPPVRLGTENLPGCPHCFAPCSPDEIERLRVTPDPQSVEDELLAELETRDGERGETLIAFALRGPATKAV